MLRVGQVSISISYHEAFGRPPSENRDVMARLVQPYCDAMTAELDPLFPGASVAASVTRYEGSTFDVLLVGDVTGPDTERYARAVRDTVCRVVAELFGPLPCATEQYTGIRPAVRWRSRLPDQMYAMDLAFAFTSAGEIKRGSLDGDCDRFIDWFGQWMIPADGARPPSRRRPNAVSEAVAGDLLTIYAEWFLCGKWLLGYPPDHRILYRVPLGQTHPPVVITGQPSNVEQAR